MMPESWKSGSWTLGEDRRESYQRGRSMADADILVVGAGPVGMLAALLSARQGLSVLLLERSAARQAQSRAIGITPPSLEILRRVGLPEAFIEHGVPVRVSGIYGRRMRLGTLDFTGLESDFRFVLSI